MADSFTLSEHFIIDAGQIYSAWLDASIHGAMTGAEAQSDAVVGGAFSAWDGYISGTYLVLEPNYKIVMNWRTTEFAADAPDSLLEMTLHPDSRGTILTLVHTNLPDGTAAEYEQGWRDYYFVPMQRYFA